MDKPECSKFASILAETAAKRRPPATIYPDGRQPSVPLPADYRVEIRDRQLAAA
jgi:hypothetical protein